MEPGVGSCFRDDRVQGNSDKNNIYLRLKNGFSFLLGIIV